MTSVRAKDLGWTPRTRLANALTRYYVGPWLGAGGTTIAFLTKRRAIRTAEAFGQDVARMSLATRTGYTRSVDNPAQGIDIIHRAPR